MDLTARVKRHQAEWRNRARSLPAAEGPWRYSRRITTADPSQGWKLHVSATILNAAEVFDRVTPLLRQRSALFKVPDQLDFLLWVNSGLGDFAQIGKFLTVYPQSDAEAVDLARALFLATQGLRGPEVPFDRRYRPDSLVYYRYGAFRPEASRTKGRNLHLVDPEGGLHPDQRGPGMAVPAWVNDPLAAASPRSRIVNPTRGPIGKTLLPFRAVSQRGKGGVYQALDLRCAPARVRILKEGRRWGEVGWDGLDCSLRLEHEARVLTQLQAGGAAVPRLIDHFTQDGNRYLLLEQLPGRVLLPARKRTGMKPDWPRAKRILDALADLIGAIHSAGWVWRDCHPRNLLEHHGKLWALDFEGACRPNETDVIPWGAPGFIPESFGSSFRRTPGTVEDHYAMGAIGFLIATGRPAAASERGRHRALREAGCPLKLCRRIQELLAVGSAEA